MCYTSLKTPVKQHKSRINFILQVISDLNIIFIVKKLTIKNCNKPAGSGTFI